jgi:hypothetical protein
MSMQCTGASARERARGEVAAERMADEDERVRAAALLHDRVFVRAERRLRSPGEEPRRGASAPDRRVRR